MILIDMSALAFIAKTALDTTDVNLIRHFIYSRIALYTRQYKGNSNNSVVLVFDSKNYWRTDYHPNYKGSRKKSRNKTQEEIDKWKDFFKSYDEIISDCFEYLPFKCIRVDRCEADDIIATLTLERSDGDVLIISPDKDFKQLHKQGVRQLSPKLKGNTEVNSDDYDLFEHIVRGDSDDDIPNIMNELDIFTKEGVRQKALSAKKLAEMRKNQDDPVMFCDNTFMFDRFKTNELLIDLTKIPKEYKDKICEEFDSYIPPKGKLMNHLVEKKLVKFMSQGGF